MVDNFDKTVAGYAIYHHDVVCNQKYVGTINYGFHLSAVFCQGNKFKHLFGDTLPKHVFAALYYHDIIEDGRMTYNDIHYDLMNRSIFTGGEPLGRGAAIKAADIVYAVTDEKGKTRAERKSDKYYSELKALPEAVFVKLADIAANTLFSKLTGSSMYDKYKSEFPKFKEKCYIEEYEEFFDYVENL